MSRRFARPALALASAGLVGSLCLATPGLAAEPPTGAALLAAGTTAPAEAATGPTDRQTAVVAQVTLKVVHPDRVRADLIDAARKAGGHPALVSDHLLQLRVPPVALRPLLEQIEAAGAVLEKSLSRDDRTQSIATLEARLRSKREVLARMRAFIDDSNVQATLRVERTLTQLIAEIEQLQGQLRVEQDRTKFARVDVSFQYRRREGITYVRSPFAWLNTVDLDRFLREF